MKARRRRLRAHFGHSGPKSHSLKTDIPQVKILPPPPISTAIGRDSTALSQNDCLRLQELFQPINAALSTNTGLLIASKWRERVMVQRVDKHASRL